MKTLAEVLVEPEVPPSKISRTKGFFKLSGGVDQVYLSAGQKAEVLFAIFYGKHTEQTRSFPLPRGNKPGTKASLAFLKSLQEGIRFFDGPFQIRHQLPGTFSRFITFTIIEQRYRDRSKLIPNAHIRALMESNDITAFDLTADTARLRELPRETSVKKGSTRFLKDHQAIVNKGTMYG